MAGLSRERGDTHTHMHRERQREGGREGGREGWMEGGREGGKGSKRIAVASVEFRVDLNPKSYT